ncbi:myo-inositol 2-dehydrogenase/D-chiro-inositol 1-dehydrogenase [Loktanella ponticola]|uniref:Myo-inositol 2-dehydrogenase/D-chiro-inositol 1-dehydrogenase n=1 Tax=Yoonia ponticola TaxID=1524255 RepID=A0A7W9BM47_9RHOB|nr:inositol 2-dehydrogenase [Yoonia ponticola]MBB5722985.1 myo-inositol 2-dehydrogenase/D-chiro-inositol 1-dehydrogenase [Yoonia ponticola]
MIRIALLGAGRIGQVHARTIRGMDNATVTAVSDFFPETAEKLAKTLGAEVRDNDTIMASDDVDAVVVGTPTDTHFDLIMAAAKAGKAIFCEKPVDMSADRIRELIAVVEKAGVPFMTAFNRRFDPSFANVQSRISAGEVGDVEMVTILSRDPTPPPLSYVKSSGGIFRDMMIHDLDMARFLLGEDPIEVVAYGSALVDPAIGDAGDVDTAGVMLKTASGKICQISNSRRATYGYDQRIEVHGAKGMLRAENHLENTVEVATEAGYRRAPTLNFFLERYESAYRREMEHFVACLNDGTAVTPTIHDGLKAQMLADAATVSCQTGKPVAV